MKKIITLIISVCVILLVCGCAPTERDLEKEIELDDTKSRIYAKAYEEGYKDAIQAVVDELPWYLVDMEKLEDSLYQIFEDEEYAEEVRDQIITYCDIYEKNDFAIDYSNDAMDYDY